MKEQQELCREVINILTRVVKEHKLEMKTETRVFYYRIIGDHYRYLAEVASADTIGVEIEKAQEHYKLAALEA